jgi:hypothetical protein
MERVLDKKLDGKLKSKEKEIEYAKKLVKRRL